MGYGIPAVQITLEKMRVGMLQALADYNDDIETYVAAELTRAIANFDYEKAVREAADAAIAEVVGTSVKHLIGWRLEQEIQRAVRKMVSERLNTQEE